MFIGTTRCNALVQHTLFPCVISTMHLNVLHKRIWAVKRTIALVNRKLHTPVPEPLQINRKLLQLAFYPHLCFRIISAQVASIRSQSLFCVDIESLCFCRAPERQKEQPTTGKYKYAKTRKKNQTRIPRLNYIWIIECIGSADVKDSGITTCPRALPHFRYIWIFTHHNMRFNWTEDFLQQWYFVFFSFFLSTAKPMCRFQYMVTVNAIWIILFLVLLFADHTIYNILIQPRALWVTHVTKICYIV